MLADFSVSKVHSLSRAALEDVNFPTIILDSEDGEEKRPTTFTKAHREQSVRRLASPGEDRDNVVVQHVII